MKKMIITLTALMIIIPALCFGQCNTEGAKNMEKAINLYQASGPNHPEIAKLLQKACEQCPNNGEPHRILGMVLYKQGKYQEAIDYLLTAVSINPDDFESHLFLGDAYNEMGHEIHAVRYYAKGTKFMETDINLVAKNRSVFEAYEKKRNILKEKTGYRDESELLSRLDRSVALRLGVAPKIETYVEFDTNKSNIKSDWAAQLDTAAEALGKTGLKSRYRFIIQGHTDERGSHEHNDGLSIRRAGSVKNYLAQKGVPASVLKTDGKGERRNLPCKSGESQEACWRKNRRVIFIACEANDSVDACLRKAQAD